MSIVLKNTNFAVSALAYDLDQTGQPAQLIVTDYTGFSQSGRFMAVIWSGGTASPLDDPEREIVELVPFGFPGFESTFNCYGGKEGTQKRNWAAGSRIAHVITAGKLDELEAEIGLKADTASAERIGTVSVKSADYSMNGAERAVIVNAGASAVRITLPEPAANTGRVFIVKRIDAGAAEVRVSAKSGELIDTQSADILLPSQWDRVQLISNGTDWYTV
ncbi:hypothetical protein EP073_12025 [Geovibrio thiophilus]|uniref:Uncharacterized protein n=1 Tax=Geovibrio thiophilus TaxID=139438 RepID=A0A3R5XY60_9BACT|nr:hypothetical protein [Geovibrio thiophilus]QAR34104.1 hypothetical protein EP073_12025 [Geovibrio thiophilus]